MSNWRWCTASDSTGRTYLLEHLLALLFYAHMRELVVLEQATVRDTIANISTAAVLRTRGRTHLYSASAIC